MRSLPVVPAVRTIELTVDGEPVRVPEGATILDACKARGVSTPTLCFAENLTPVNVCRVCVGGSWRSAHPRPLVLAPRPRRA